MKANFINSAEADDNNKRAAALDAIRRNANNRSLYTPQQQLRAERMELILKELFSAATRVYINYRKTKIAVKVDGKRDSVRNLKQWRAFENDWAQLGVKKTVSAQGFVYSFV